MVAIRRMLSGVAVLPVLPAGASALPAGAVGNQQEVIGRYAGVVPLEWGQEVTGVVAASTPAKKGWPSPSTPAAGGQGLRLRRTHRTPRKEGHTRHPLHKRPLRIRVNPETFASSRRTPFSTSPTTGWTTGPFR